MAKRLTILAFLFIISFELSYSQVNSSKTTCENFNNFLTSNTLDDLKYYSDSIYSHGSIIFDESKSNEWDGIDDLYQLLHIDQGSTFELVKETQSLLDSDKRYYKYQQFFNGIKVEGGGYTVVLRATNPGIPVDPCGRPSILSTSISSGININATKTPFIKSRDLSAILESDPNLTSELIITHNLLNDCQYNLVWKTQYSKEEYGSISWVDAHSGVILKTIEGDDYLCAPTLTYETNCSSTITNSVFLDDFSDGNVTQLVSSDERVRTFDFANSLPSFPVNSSDWSNNLIPSTNSNQWTTEAPERVFQAHHVTSSILPIFDDIDIDFTEVSVASSSLSTASSIFEPTAGLAFITLGIRNGVPTALFDIAGHELGHSFLNGYGILGRDQAGNRSLQEGISDMLGTYVESIVQGNVDWSISDDEPSIVQRDLSNPGGNFDTFEKVKNLGPGDRHDRSRPLGHWFFLITEGDGDEIEGLGIETSIQIVREALNLISFDADYPEFREKVMLVVIDQFGLCSTETNSVGLAWSKIEVGPSGWNDCDFTVYGQTIVCEEDDQMLLNIIDPIAGASYIWTFPIEWTVQGGPGNPNGNKYTGKTFRVTDFPKYDWYPRYFNIKINSVQLPSEFDQTIRVKLEDCNGDDPTCEEFHSNRTKKINLGLSEKNSLKNREFVKVFDVIGREYFSGKISNFKLYSLPKNSIFVISYFSKDKQLISTEKIVISN